MKTEESCKLKIDLKNREGEILFSYEKEDNTIKDTLLEAIKLNYCLKGVDLSNADLSGIYIKDKSLTDANIYNANFENSILINVDLTNCIGREANFKNSTLIQVKFNGSNLHSADFTFSVIKYTDFSNCIFSRNCKFYHAQIIESWFMDSDFKLANFEEASIVSTDFTHSYLVSTTFCYTNIINCYFDEADLSGSKMYSFSAVASEFNKTKMAGLMYGDFNSFVLCKLNIVELNKEDEKMIERDLKE